jgi:hypothetical protein
MGEVDNDAEAECEDENNKECDQYNEVRQLQASEKQLSMSKIYMEEPAIAVSTPAELVIFHRHSKHADISTFRDAITHDSHTSSVAECEDSLYKEYQQELRDPERSRKYDFNEETLSFEEWKVKKKQFKLGTRGSFVRAYQMFEQREQVIGSDASVGNTLHLMGSTVHNPLMNKKKK